MKSKIIDTNIIVRLLIKDNRVQFQQAQEIIEDIENGSSIGHISILVLNELIWILENFYSVKRTVYIPQILKLLSLRNIRIVEIDKQTTIKVLTEFQEDSIDLTDIYLLHIRRNIKQSMVVSFDKDIRKWGYD